MLFFPFKQVKEPANRESVRGFSWFVCFKFMNKWVGFFLHPKCESDAIKSKNTARKQLKKKITKTISVEEEGSDFWVLPLLLLLLVNFTLLTTCVNQRFYMHLWQLYVSNSVSTAPPDSSLFETVCWNTFFPFCTLIFFLGNMMSKIIFHFRERLFFFSNIWWLSIFLHKPCWKQSFHHNSYVHGLC